MNKGRIVWAALLGALAFGMPSAAMAQAAPVEQWGIYEITLKGPAGGGSAVARASCASCSRYNRRPAGSNRQVPSSIVVSRVGMRA